MINIYEKRDRDRDREREREKKVKELLIILEETSPN
jgi:hypothetical protein